MTSVEVLAAKRMVEGLEYSPARDFAISGLAQIADGLKVVEKLEAEAAELAAYGGIAGAEAGWNALRQHNPNIDRSTGARDITCFADLPHKKKLESAAFAFGVLNPGAKLGSPVPVEPYQFKVGDRVRITGPRIWSDGTPSLLHGGRSEYGVIRPSTNHHNDLGVRDDTGRFGYIVPSSLTLVTEPRTWSKLQDIPKGIKVTDDDGDLVEHDGSRWGFMDDDGEWGSSSNLDGPFAEVIA